MDSHRTPDEQVSQTKIEWPQSKGDPIRPVWSYAKKKGMYEAEALRMMAHDLVERLKELELPLRRAMKEASGDGLTEMAYIKMMNQRLNASERENYRLRKQIERLAGEVQTLQERA
jgi:hypothetical protein